MFTVVTTVNLDVSFSNVHGAYPFFGVPGSGSRAHFYVCRTSGDWYGLYWCISNRQGYADTGIHRSKKTMFDSMRKEDLIIHSFREVLG